MFVSYIPNFWNCRTFLRSIRLTLCSHKFAQCCYVLEWNNVKCSGGRFFRKVFCPIDFLLIVCMDFRFSWIDFRYSGMDFQNSGNDFRYFGMDFQNSGKDFRYYGIDFRYSEMEFRYFLYVFWTHCLTMFGRLVTAQYVNSLMFWVCFSRFSRMLTWRRSWRNVRGKCVTTNCMISSTKTVMIWISLLHVRRR